MSGELRSLRILAYISDSWVGKFRVAQLSIYFAKTITKYCNPTKKDTSLIFAGYHDIEKNHPICVSR